MLSDAALVPPLQCC